MLHKSIDQVIQFCLITGTSLSTINKNFEWADSHQTIVVGSIRSGHPVRNRVRSVERSLRRHQLNPSSHNLKYVALPKNFDILKLIAIKEGSDCKLPKFSLEHYESQFTPSETMPKSSRHRSRKKNKGVSTFSPEISSVCESFDDENTLSETDSVRFIDRKKKTVNINGVEKEVDEIVQLESNDSVTTRVGTISHVFKPNLKTSRGDESFPTHFVHLPASYNNKLHQRNGFAPILHSSGMGFFVPVPTNKMGCAKLFHAMKKTAELRHRSQHKNGDEERQDFSEFDAARQNFDTHAPDYKLLFIFFPRQPNGSRTICGNEVFNDGARNLDSGELEVVPCERNFQDVHNNKVHRYEAGWLITCPEKGKGIRLRKKEENKSAWQRQGRLRKDAARHADASSDEDFMNQSLSGSGSSSDSKYQLNSFVLSFKMQKTTDSRCSYHLLLQIHSVNAM